MKNKRYLTLILNTISTLLIFDFLSPGVLGISIREFIPTLFPYGGLFYTLFFVSVLTVSISLTISRIKNRKKEETLLSQNPISKINSFFSIFILIGVIILFITFVFTILMVMGLLGGGRPGF